MHRLWLIAVREFRAYATTASFWVALAAGPVLMAAAAGALSLASSSEGPAWRIAIESRDRHLAEIATSSLAEAAQLRGARLEPVQSGEAGATVLVIERRSQERVDLRVAAGVVDPTAIALLRRDLASNSTGLLSIETPPAQAPAEAGEGPARFALMMLLWLTLTGSLGMLLQAIVRERANRALESLLASARPTEIIFGKLMGVGAVSLLVLAAWLGAASLLASPAVGGAVASDVFAQVAGPMLLLKAAGIYVLAYAMYGSAMLGIGGLARDLPSAQNLSRPVFGVLLVVFFVALAMAAGAPGPSWLVYLPPFTPFLLLIDPPPIAGQLVCGALLAATAAAGCWLASKSLSERRQRRHEGSAVPAA